MWMIFVAMASATEFDVSVGTELMTNEAFLNLVGARLGATVRPLPWLGAGLSVAGYPVHLSTTRLEQVETLGLVPDLSPMQASTTLTGLVRFARGSAGPIDGALDLVVGGGGVRTVDDCEAILAEDDPSCLATQDQIHLVSIVGLAATAGAGAWALRLRGERWAYTEVVMESVEEQKVPVWVGADLVWRPGRQP